MIYKLISLSVFCFINVLLKSKKNVRNGFDKMLNLNQSKFQIIIVRSGQVFIIRILLVLIENVALL